jgi:predicted GNAT family acetyltransferase
MDDEGSLREQDVGEGLARALVQHAMTTAKDSGLDPRSVIDAAAQHLQRHVSSMDVDWRKWAAEHDVRNDQGKRKN